MVAYRVPRRVEARSIVIPQRLYRLLPGGGFAILTLMSRLDFNIRSGNDLVRRIKWYEVDRVTPIDLNSFGVRLTVRGGPIDVEYDDDAVIYVDIPADGEMVMDIPAATVTAWRETGFSRFEYSLYLDQPDGNIRTLLYGYINIGDADGG